MRYGAKVRAARWALAVIGLQGTWMFACEAWRDVAPLGVVALATAGWFALASAWRAFLPAGRGTTLRLAGVLLLLDIVVDVVNPTSHRFALVGWEIARAGVVIAAGEAATRLGGAAWRHGARALRAFSLAVAALVPGAMVYVAFDGTRDEAAPADAALVLGLALDDAGRPRPGLVLRMDRAADLWRRGLVPVLVLSGGAPKAGRTEARVMKELAMARGVPSAALLLDESARSTVENFACSLPILRSTGARQVLVVTEPWHMPRAMRLARRHGIDARAAPAAWTNVRAALWWLFRDANAFVREMAREPWAKPGVCASPQCEGCRTF